MDEEVPEPEQTLFIQNDTELEVVCNSTELQIQSSISLSSISLSPGVAVKVWNN